MRGPQRVTLVRHGETTGQSSIRYHGATDVTLSAAGKAQMRRVGKALVDQRFDAIFSSRLQRSRDAAALIVADGQRPVPVAAFDEVNFGHWEGWTREEIAARDPTNHRLWQHRADMFTYPGGESRQAFIQRVTAGLADVLRTASGDNILMVLHRGVIGIILAELLQLHPQHRRALQIDLASIHIVAHHRGQWQSECLNRIEHLHELDPTHGTARISPASGQARSKS